MLVEKMDKYNDGIQRFSTALETIAEVKEQIQGQEEILKGIRNQIQKNGKAKTTNIGSN